MAGIKDYSTTNLNNTSLNGISVAEGMLPSQLNNAIRALMVNTRSWFNDSQWVEYGDGDGAYTAAYASATSFTIAGVDVTPIYHEGRRIKLIASTPGTIYGTISSSTFSTNTTVNVTWDSGSLSNEAITNVYIGALSKTNNSLPTGVIATATLADGSVTTIKIADSAVTTAKINDAAVTNAKLGADSVNGSKIADDSIDSEHYVDGSIDTVHIADSQITTAKIADTAITTAKITDSNVTNSKLATNSVTAVKITDANITTAKIADDAIDGTKIADDSINSEHYVDGSIDTQHIADSQITTAKIADSNVTTAKIADSNVTTAKINNDAVTAAKIADAVIVTNAEQSGHTPDDVTFFTTSASDGRYFRQDSSETIDSGDTWSGSDAFIATTAAIDARVIDLVDDVGGFFPISSETNFPNTNPDVNDGAGTIVSIKEMATTRTPSGGTVTISGGTVGGSTVTITGCGSTVLTAGFGVLVETTTTLNTYTFHRLVPKATEVTTVAAISSDITTVAGDTTDIGVVSGLSSDIQALADIEDGTTATNAISNVGNNISSVVTTASNISGVNSFADRYRVSATAPTTSLDSGDLYFDTSTNILNVYGASGWQNAGSSVNGTSQRYNYTATNAQTTFTGADNNGNTLAYDAGYIDVYLNGVKLLNGTDVTVTSGSSIVLASGATTGDVVDIVAYGTFSVASLNADNLDSGTVPDARITGAYTGITNLTMTGDLTVDTNTLKVDSTNNRVGIGSTDPSNDAWSGANSLVIKDTSGDNGITIISSSTTNNGNIAFADSSGGSFSDIGGLITYLHNGDSMRFMTANAERMRITSTGLGIGTSSPSEQLDVDGNINLTDSLLIDGAIKFEAIKSSSTGQDSIYKTATNTLAFNTGGTERMRIDSSGKVGIGVTNLNRNLAIGTLGTKTDTSTKYVMNIGQTSESSSYAGLGVYYVGASSVSNRKWQFQPTENGVANDGIIEFNPYGGRFKAVNGIQLGGDTDANKLDDYEEGTWTPVYKTSGNNYPSITYDAFTGGKYTKIGRLVSIQATLRTDVVDDTGTSGVIQIAGLPFASSGNTGSTRDGISALAIGDQSGWKSGHTPNGGVINSGDTDITITKLYANTDDVANVPSTDLQTGANNNRINIQGIYVTDA